MIRALVVDDEEPARTKLRSFLEAEEGIEIVGEAADGGEAIEAILELSPDLVFLDIQMPRVDGFEVVRQIGHRRMPWVVFVTAYDEYALEAFEVQAIDYLLKPFARRRLRQALASVRERMDTRERAASADRLRRLLDRVGPGKRHLTRILARKSIHREVMLAVDDIDVIRARGNYLDLETCDGTLRCRGPLSTLEQRLDPDRFLRINRGEIVRLDAVAEFQPWFHGDYRVVLKKGAVLSWSRRYRKRRKTDFAPVEERKEGG